MSCVDKEADYRAAGIRFHLYGIPVSKIKGENYYDTMIMHLGKELMEVKVISGTNIALNQPACFALLDGFIAELKPSNLYI